MSTIPTPTTGSHPAPRAGTGRPRTGASRAGHAVAVVVNLLVLYVVNVWPSWEAVPFLTADTTLVLGLVNASLWVSVLAEASYVVVTSAWWRALGDIVTTGVGLAAVIRIWEVFPFDVTSGWDVGFHVVLGIAAVGSAIGIIAAIVRLVRALAAPARGT
jgi:hypothetical protein